MGGAEWTAMQFETVDGEVVNIRTAGNSSVSIKMKTLDCTAHFPQVRVGPHPNLADIGYFFDSDAQGKFHLLSIPTIELSQGKQIHKSINIYIRQCKIEKIESEVEYVFPG